MDMIYFRFVNIEQRMEVWSKRPLAKKNNLYMEEWLTGMNKLYLNWQIFFVQLYKGYREKLFAKCKLLKKDGLIKEVFTERGDIKVVITLEEGDTEERSVWTDKDLDILEEELGKKKV